MLADRLRRRRKDEAVALVNALLRDASALPQLATSTLRRSRPLPPRRRLRTDQSQVTGRDSGGKRRERRAYSPHTALRHGKITLCADITPWRGGARGRDCRRRGFCHAGLAAGLIPGTFQPSPSWHWWPTAVWSAFGVCLVITVVLAAPVRGAAHSAACLRRCACTAAKGAGGGPPTASRPRVRPGRPPARVRPGRRPCRRHEARAGGGPGRP